MKTIIQLIKKNADGADIEKALRVLETKPIRIENEPWMRLCIEAIGPSVVEPYPAISVAHYGEQNGDLMRDPDIEFAVILTDGKVDLLPTNFRNDYAGFDQPIFLNKDQFYPKRLKDCKSFCRTWDKNIRQQGFLEAFDRLKDQSILRDI